MTILGTRPESTEWTEWVGSDRTADARRTAPQACVTGAGNRARRVFSHASAARRPAPGCPPELAVRFRGTGVPMSRAVHRRRPVAPVTTVLVALTAAAITLWLGVMAQMGGVVGRDAGTPSRLAVVQVRQGETLEHVARRVAPGAPVGAVVERIRELNHMGSVSVDAGQTLIAPVG